MSYSIVFETKICKLDNGDIIHFSRQGCNNDTEGRTRDDFRGKLYTSDEWEKEIIKWESMESDEGFDLKIGSRYCSINEYGKHLRRMTKRAKSFEDMKKERTIYGIAYDGMTYYPDNGEPIYYPAEADNSISDIVYGIWYGRYKGYYIDHRHTLETLDDIVNKLKKDNGKYVRFYIGKTHK